MASEEPIGGLRWQNPMCLLINALSFESLFLTLCASKGWEAHSRAGLWFWIKAYSRSPHEYLICVAAITHFTSPLCPLVDVIGVCARVCLMTVCVLQCKLEQQACLTGKDLTLKCSGLCPCPTTAPTTKESKHGESNIHDIQLMFCFVLFSHIYSSITAIITA